MKVGSHKEQSPEGIELRRLLYERILNVIDFENVSYNAVAYLIGASNSTMARIKNNSEITIYNVVRILDAMGYELQVVKLNGVPKVKDKPEIQKRIGKFKQKQLDAKRIERNQPIGKFLPPKVRTKRTRIEKEHIIVTRKQLEEELRKSEGTLFGDI